MKLKLLVAMATGLLSSASMAATFTYAGGSGQRSLGLLNNGPVGQTFIATGDNALTSFGFQLRAINPTQADGPITFTLLNGSGFNGSVVATRTATAAGVGFLDFDLTGTTLVAGQSYTALLTSQSTRYALIYGPDINLFTGALLGGDAYAGGRLIASNFTDAPCSTGMCDSNFRYTATAAVPEPAAWALMIGGFGLVGGTLRNRRMATRVTFA